MSITERVEEIIADRNGSETTRALRDKDEMSQAERETLLRCSKALATFGAISGLRELHQGVLKGRGNLTTDSYVEANERIMAVSTASLSWQDEDEIKPKQINVSIKKLVGREYPFKLTIEASNDIRFTTEIDSPEAEQLSRDDDTGRWDDIHDNDLGFFLSQEDLKDGIEERLAIAYAQLVARK